MNRFVHGDHFPSSEKNLFYAKNTSQKNIKDTNLS